jgi:2-aminoethylphosphonate-pyruvate transaminase
MIETQQRAVSPHVVSVHGVARVTGQSGHECCTNGQRQGVQGQLVAIVLAAGEGRSLFPLTRSLPKSLLCVGGVTILRRLAMQLAAVGIRDLVVVAGFEREQLVKEVQEIRHQVGLRVEVVNNDRYAFTNNLYSLALAERFCRGAGVLVIDGDVVCEDAVLSRVVNSLAEIAVAVDSRRVMGEEESKARVDRGRVKAVGKDIRGGAEFFGVSKFSPGMAKNLFGAARRLLARGLESAFYESAFNMVLRNGNAGTAIDVAGARWTEVDFATDYEEALRLFGTRQEWREYQRRRKTKKQYLFCPGPVLISRGVKAALSTDQIGHREVEFSELLNRVRLKLGRVYGVRNFHAYSTVIITGSGSAANEALLGTAGTDKTLLMLSNGEFGERLIELAAHLELRFVPLRFRWGKSLALDKIEDAASDPAIDAVCMVHHETSTGMLNPLARIAAIARKCGKELFVDAVSSLGASPVNVEENQVTFCTGSANKAISSVPGLSFVCGRRDAFARLRTVHARSLYLDLYRHFVYNDRNFQTPNTPAVNLICALEAALDAILEKGLEHTFERYQKLARQMRAGLKKSGFRFLIPEADMSPVLTTVELPTGFGAEEFHDALKDLGYVTYAGKGILRDRVFQVGNIGELTRGQVQNFLKAIAKIQR